MSPSGESFEMNATAVADLIVELYTVERLREKAASAAGEIIRAERDLRQERDEARAECEALSYELRKLRERIMRGIVVTVQGGVVQGVVADFDAPTYVLDYDVYEDDGPEPAIGAGWVTRFEMLDEETHETLMSSGIAIGHSEGEG